MIYTLSLFLCLFSSVVICFQIYKNDLWFTLTCLHLGWSLLVVICFQIYKNDLWFTLKTEQKKVLARLWFAFRFIKTIFDLHSHLTTEMTPKVVICFQIYKNDLWFTLCLVCTIVGYTLWFAFRFIKTIFDLHWR